MLDAAASSTAEIGEEGQPQSMATSQLQSHEDLANVRLDDKPQRVSIGSHQSGGSKDGEESPEALSSVSSEDICVICLDSFDTDIMPRCCPEKRLSCEVLYETLTGEFTTVTFTSRPLGMVTVVNREPVTVSVVVIGSPSESLGVQEGWIIRGVDGVDVSSKPFAEVFDHLRSASSRLPSPPVECQGCHRKFHCECIQNWVVKGSDSCPTCRQKKLPLAMRKLPKQDPQGRADIIPEPVWGEALGSAWSSHMDMSDCIYQDLFPHGCLFTCCCPCMVAERIVHNAQHPSESPSWFTNFGFILMGVFFGLAIIWTFVLPYIGDRGNCTLANTGFLFVQISREVRGQCSAREQIGFIVARVSWFGFVLMLALHRHWLANRFGIKDNCKALLCQCCGCYSCTLAQEGRHVLHAQALQARAMATMADNVQRGLGVSREQVVPREPTALLEAPPQEAPPSQDPRQDVDRRSPRSQGDEADVEALTVDVPTAPRSFFRLISPLSADAGPCSDQLASRASNFVHELGEGRREEIQGHNMV